MSVTCSAFRAQNDRKMADAVSPSQNLLNERAVAHLVSMSVSSLRRWRRLGKGPRFIKLYRSVKYRADDVTAWLNERPVGGGEPEGTRYTVGRDTSLGSRQ